MDPRRTAQVLREVYGENALSVALRWRDRSGAAGAFWSLVAAELESDDEAPRLAAGER